MRLAYYRFELTTYIEIPTKTFWLLPTYKLEENNTSLQFKQETSRCSPFIKFTN